MDTNTQLMNRMAHYHIDMHRCVVCERDCVNAYHVSPEELEEAFICQRCASESIPGILGIVGASGVHTGWYLHYWEFWGYSFWHQWDMPRAVDYLPATYIIER